MKKRILSILCALCLIVGLLPVTAMAAANNNGPDSIRLNDVTLTNGQYLATNDATAASTYTSGETYVALYKDGVLASQR